MINNKILALKYRPQEFKDLIGQEVMAQIITNAIKLGKTPNAYLLTGIRGVGKTTTARLIAKALNCVKQFDEGEKCKAGEYCHCDEIVNSNHMDILEMDAASKTGIDDIRELIENAKYSPTSAKFKIFIIDEAHMLSKQAFNGLLKTLEEPPPRLKFILATTEVRKIPVTILSRCQRFDLRRVNLEKLFLHLKNIAHKENGSISDNALQLIARTSEGSVRDAISLLDRALLSQSIYNKEIQEQHVRQMLGLADRSKLILLFKEILSGNQIDAINYLKEMIDHGLDAKNFLNDILEILYLFNRRINLGPIEKDLMISESEIKLINDYSKNIDSQDIGLFWQLTIKTMDDLRIVGNENLTLEMYVMQLMHLKNIDQNQEVSADPNSNGESLEIQKISTPSSDEQDDKKIKSVYKNQLKNTDQIKTNLVKNPELNSEPLKTLAIKTFEDLIQAATREKEVELKYDLERNVKLVSFTTGKINISFNEKLNKNFIKILTEKLLKWTGERWIISLSKEQGNETIYEKNLNNKKDKLEKEMNSQVVKDFIAAFPDAKLVDITEDNDA
ncbi:MAG: DNA polymerase III subunit gamma/tau [Proteobacteria bacterium]|jgi:DNA polymerase III subunit gamma/tau|nr:DNA polymerase III subunit gamma/tau [Pseudomonadota bacterium]